MATRNEIELLIKARDEASKALDDVTKKIQGLAGSASPASSALGEVEKSASGVGQRILEMAGGFLTAQVAFAGMQRAADLLVGSFEKGIKSIDDLKLAQAAMAGAAATNDPSIAFEKAYDIAGKMVQRVQLLSATFIGTGDELAQLAQAMVTFGLGLDLSNEKAEKNFISFANMFKIMTAGQDFQRQVMSEIRALAQGQEVAGAMVVRYLEAAGINVKQMVPIWKEQGTLLENIMKIMSGYDTATGKIANTLQTQKTTLETITQKILREGTQVAYDDILGSVTHINSLLMDQNGLTVQGKTLVDAMRNSWDLVAPAIRDAAAVSGGFFLTLLQGFNAWYTVTKERIEGAKQEYREFSEKYGGGGFLLKMIGSAEEARIKQLMGIDMELAAFAKEGGGASLRLPPSPSQPTDSELKAAESFQKKIEDLYDKLSVERALERGEEVEAAFLKSRIDFINRNRAILDLAEKAKLVPEGFEATGRMTGYAGAPPEVQQALDLSREQQLFDELKFLEKMRDNAVKGTQKNVDAKIKLEEGWAAAVAKTRESVLRREEKFAELMANYQEQQRYADERVPRPWDLPGKKERDAALHKFELDKKHLEAERRQYELDPRGGKGLNTEQYEAALAESVTTYQKKLAQIEDATNESTARQAAMWDEMFGGLDRTASDLFFDAFSGKLKTMGDYFDAALNVMRRAWANFLSDMLTKWIETQARSAMTSGGGFGGFLSGLFGGGSGGASAAGGADWFETMGGGELIMAASGGVFPGSFVPIRAFSGGGVASRPTLGMIAEAGVSEAVVPMPSGKIPVELRGDQGRNVHLTLNINAIDSRSVKQMLIEERGTIVGLVRNGIETAGPMRDAVRR